MKQVIGMKILRTLFLRAVHGSYVVATTTIMVVMQACSSGSATMGMATPAIRSVSCVLDKSLDFV